MINTLKDLPHFDPELSSKDTPESVIALRQSIEQADAVLFCTPEYIFSIPSGLKNVLEWCVSTTIFAQKPVGIITAAANGAKGHEELQLIMNTLMATFNQDTTLLIQGAKGKVSEKAITDNATEKQLHNFIGAFLELVNTHKK